MSNMNNIKKHFEDESEVYDGIIKNLIPYYHQMVEAIVNSIPFDHHKEFQAFDLGCGTGTVAKALNYAFPKAKLTCLDISEKMLKIAGSKLKNAPDTTYICSDFYNFNFEKEYNAIVSSLALHHLVTKEDKLAFYKKIHSGLHTRGIFINADVVLASSDALQKTYMEQWINYQCRNISKEEVENKWIPTYYEEDRPASVMEHIEMLKEAGFAVIDIVWKYYNFAVYMAIK